MVNAFQIPVSGDATLAGVREGADGPPVVLLHSGVGDKRSWSGLFPHLSGIGRLVAYDRRGFGESVQQPRTDYTHVDDLLDVLDVLEGTGAEPAWLVGSSQGGRIALDTALLHPTRVAGLVLLAPAVSGAPDRDDLDADTARIDAALEVADEASDVDEINRLEAWLWLDGPTSPERRVGGAARELFLDMNGLLLRNQSEDSSGDVEATTWDRLGEISAQATVAWGDLDVPIIIEQSRELAERLPSAHTQVFSGMAHLPYLEDPAAVARTVRAAISPAS